MRKIIDLTGKKFGRLTVIRRADDYVFPSGRHLVCWLCKCECGNEVFILADNLKSGHTTSCGCFKKEKSSTTHKKHGLLKNTRLYNTWRNIKSRCHNINRENYKYYGARGIKVCDEWKDDFQNFYTWAMENGYKENLTIDRIDANGNYEPSNCRWVDMKTQCRNRRDNRLITINEKTLTLAEWCEILNLNYDKIERRLNKYHWSPEKALEVG